MKNRLNLLKIISIILLYTFFATGCTENENNKKKLKEYTHYYPSERITSDIDRHETVYVPVYSHVYTSDEKYELMGITLSVRNTDFKQNMWIKKISYYSTQGELLESYVSKSHELNPMASIDFVVDLNDIRGGSGANFIVEWEGSKTLSNPIIQAVMVNNSGNKAFSFITNGENLK
ncbi:DUF3124 domain-containing protein [Arcobacter sp.]|uniref:DUF3124 domain-containing protein n=1 Tax=unclassified Arcobacter TaxID=2593671 RepID=UPI003AFF9643